MYFVKIYRNASGNVLIISADYFELLGFAINIYRKDMEQGSYDLFENDHVYIMDGTGETVDHVVIKAKKE